MSADPSTATTIREVAAQAGVSTATVSRVLSGKGYATESVRKLVFDAAQALNYRPSRQARALRRAKTKSIAVLVNDLSNPVHHEFLRGVEHIANQADYTVLVADSQRNSELESQILSRLLAEGIDGILMAGSRPTADIVDAFSKRNIPIMPFVGRDGQVRELEWEKAEAIASREMVEHLLNLGHRRVAIVVAAPDRVKSRTLIRRSRLDIPRTELAKVSGTLIQVQVEIRDLYRSCLSHLAALFGGTSPPTAVIVSGHRLLPAVLMAIRDCHLQIPADVSLVAYGDSEWAMAFQPALSVVSHDVYVEAIGYTRTLLAMLGDCDLSELEGTEVISRFTPRASCAPPRI